MRSVVLPNTPGGDINLVFSVRLNVVHPVGSNFLFSFKLSKSQKWRPITYTLNCRRGAQTSWEAWNIPVTRQRERGRVIGSWLRQITTVFNWNRISFSRLRWHPGQQILKAGPCKRGNNKLQWADQRLQTTDLCLLILRGSSTGLLDAAKEGTILSGLWPPGHPFSSRRWLMFIIVLVIMGWMRWADASLLLWQLFIGSRVTLNQRYLQEQNYHLFFFFCTVENVCSTFKAIVTHFTSVHLIPYLLILLFLGVSFY